MVDWQLVSFSLHPTVSSSSAVVSIASIVSSGTDRRASGPKTVTQACHIYIYINHIKLK